MFGTGKPRTKLGKWLDKKGVTQSWLMKKSGLNKNTISELTGDKNRLPTLRTMQKVIKALREIDPKVNSNDFWDV
ncbi:helix-turn-helix domain-containing protein [Priestia aryabhattai]|uniref:helix-turn-helix domain-containing protein n=1 Tax=Priestia aryabhattai TaxID=412384 RepID=UPI003C8DA245